MTALLRAMRPRQWLKNLLIFVPCLTSHSAGASVWTSAGIAFVVFCLCASSAYLLNDVLDVPHDRQHPVKRLRPLAAGQLGVPLALGCAALLACGGLALAQHTSPALSLTATVYFIGTVAYSVSLKRLLLVDVTMLAALYTVRVVAGGAATGIALTAWLLTFSFFLFLSLALLKRHSELQRMASAAAGTVPGRGYLPQDRVAVGTFGIAAGMTANLVLLLYYSSPAVAQLYHSPLALAGVVPLFFIWLARLWLLSFRGEIDEDPLLYVSTDAPSLLIIAGCVALGLAASL
jgi:4-hydroxybenzoate polyprenyltransferase